MYIAMGVNPTPVSPASLGSLASFEMVAVNDDDAARSDNTVPVALQLEPDVNDVGPIVDNAFAVALRMEATLSSLHATEHIETKLSESDHVKHPYQ